MDQHKLRSLVFEKTGVKVDSDDPIFALVALNETVLAEAVGRHLALMEEASKKLDKQLKQLQKFGVAAAVPAPAPSAPHGKIVDNWESDDGEPAAATASSATGHGGGNPKAVAAPLPAITGLSAAHWQVGAAAAAIAMVAALLVVGAQALFARAPAAVLSTQQTEKMAHADKLDRAMQKLDPKTRETIAQEMQKP